MPGGGPYIPASEASPSTVTGSNAPSEGPSPSGVHTHVGMLTSGGATLLPPHNLSQQQRQTYTTYADLQQQYELDGSSSSSLPTLPEPSASYTLPSEGDGDGHHLLGADFDLGFNLCDDDKDQYAFLAELAGDDTVNVLV